MLFYCQSCEQLPVFCKPSTPDACLVMTLRRHITWHTDRTAGCRAGKIHPTSIRCRITFWQFLQGIQYVLSKRRQPHSGHLCRIEEDEKRQGKWWSFDYGRGDLIKYLVGEKKKNGSWKHRKNVHLRKCVMEYNKPSSCHEERWVTGRGGLWPVVSFGLN